MSKKPNMKKWSQAKLDMEIACAGWALDGGPETKQWLDDCIAEQKRRTALSPTRT